MASHSPTESHSSPHPPDLSLRSASLQSWNLFSSTNWSRVPPDPPPNRPYRSRSLRNCPGDGAGTGLGGSRPNERVKKGGEGRARSQREGHHGFQEGGRQRGLSSNRNSSSLPTGMMMPTVETARRRRSQGRAAEVTDTLASVRADRPGTSMAHHQHHHHHHHHDHHHHHYHYHHHYHHFPRQSNAYQDQGVLLSSSSTSAAIESLGRPASRSASQHLLLSNPDTSFMNNRHQLNNPREAAMEARDRLDERLRNAAFLNHRHSNVGLPTNFLDEFGLPFDDDEDPWSDGEIWEIGIQNWLEVLGFEESWHPDPLPSSERVSLSPGMSKADIRQLHKEVFVPRGMMRDKHAGDKLYSSEQDDCSVCLEHFLPGQLLICLPCKHRFHPDCLSPWLEGHGQCPYCRAKVNCERRVEASSSWSGRHSGNGVSPSVDDFVAWLEAVDSGISRFNIR